MTKDLFCECAEALREYWNWECEMSTLGVNLDSTAAGGLADMLMLTMCDGDADWDVDPVTGWSWIGIWCGAPEGQIVFNRNNYPIRLPSAGALYDFVNEMNVLGWPDGVEYRGE